MYPVSRRFLDVIAGSHQMAVRVQVLPTDGPQFGPAPTGGVELPLSDEGSSDVKLSSDAAVTSTVELTVPGSCWDLVAPYGAELFVERGVRFGPGDVEYVPLGYFGIEELNQDDAPNGTIRVEASDRAARAARNRLLVPWTVPDGTSHRRLFHRLLNGNLDADTPGHPTRGQASVDGQGYGMFLRTVVPIRWTGYDPDQAQAPSGTVVEGDPWDFLRKMLTGRGQVLRMSRTGEVLVCPADAPPGADPVYWVRAGEGGNLVKLSRSVARRSTPNVVVARGSDPAFPTGYRIAYQDDPTSPLYWAGAFGVVPRFYASPVLKTAAAADQAAATLLAQYSGLPTTVGVATVPNPAVDPLDVLAVEGEDVNHLADEVSIPLTGDNTVTIDTRALNDVPAGDDITEGQPAPENPPPADGGTPTTPGTGAPTERLAGPAGAPAAPSGAVIVTGTSAGTTYRITKPGYYDFGGRTVGQINIAADDVTVSNFVCRGAGNSGVYAVGARVTVQNGDIGKVNPGGVGDINAVTWFGDGFKLLYCVVGETVALVDGDPGGSHTDGAQTWNTATKRASKGVLIQGCRFVGPLPPDKAYLHQGVQMEAADSDDGGGGGTGVTGDVTIADCYFKTGGNQVLNFLGTIKNVVITRNRFAGKATKIVNSRAPGEVKYFGDNKIVDGGAYGSVGVSTIAGPGPGGPIMDGPPVGGTPGGGTPGGSTGGGTGTLAERWRIGFGAGLSKVNLGVDFLPGDGPSGKTGLHVDYDLAALVKPTLPAELTKSSRPYVELRPDGAVRLTSYVGGATTKNSTHSRNETRGLAQDGVGKQVVDSTKQDAYLWVRGAVIKAPSGRPNICLVQWHDPDDDLCMIQWQGGKIISTFGDTGRPGTLATGVPLGTVYQAMIRLVKGQRIEYYWQNMSTPGATQAHPGAGGLYGKIGNYQQSSTQYDPVGETAIVDVYDLEYWATGYPEPAARHQ